LKEEGTITSSGEHNNIYDMVKEFEIELLDDYFQRALARRRSALKMSE